jgi:prevent-host-death family protein
MDTIGMFEARTHFSDYMRAVKEGREFVITSRGEEIAMLSPVQRKHSPESVQRCLERLAKLRAARSASGPVLKEGESWNDFAREGLKW